MSSEGSRIIEDSIGFERFPLSKLAAISIAFVFA